MAFADTQTWTKTPTRPATRRRLRAVPGVGTLGGYARSRMPVSRSIVSGTVCAVDFATILLTALAASVLRGGETGAAGTGLSTVYIVLATALAGVAVLRFQQLYTFRTLLNHRRQVAVLLRSWTLICMAIIAVGFLTRSDSDYSRGWAVTWFTFTLVAFALTRVALALRLRRWVKEGRLARNAVVFGAGERTTTLIDTIHNLPDEPLNIVGIFDERATRLPETISGVPVAGGFEALEHYVRDNQIDEVIIALPANAHARINGFVRRLSLLPIDLRICFDAPTDRVTLKGFEFYGNIPVGKIFDRPLQNWNAVVKRGIDLVLSAAGLVVLTPALLIVAGLIKLDSPGPVLFLQKRFGFNNKIIDVFKFRTMYVERQNVGGEMQTRKNDPRVTRLGRFLRKSSVDELPQLLNVLLGNMSLVGPRPHALGMRAADELYYDAVSEYFGRHRVKPGITGWAQVHGLRGETDTLPKAQLRVEYDLHYIENWSALLDIQIILKTFVAIFRHKNAY